MTKLKKAIQAKIEERRATEYLKKCRAATAAALAAIVDEAEATGEAPQAVLNHYLGKTPTRAEARRSQSEAEKTLALLRQSKAPAKSAAPAPAKAAAAKPAAAKPAAKPTTAASPSPYTSAPTDHLVLLVRRGYIAGRELDAARAELSRRGVKIHRSGYTISNKNTQ